MTRWRLLAGLMLAVGCADESTPEPVINRCSAALGCASGDLCDPDLSMCVRPKVDPGRSYDYIVQVGTNRPGLVGRTWGKKRTLIEAPKLEPIAIRSAVPMRGKILGRDTPTAPAHALQAEIAFFPRRELAYLSIPLSVFTQLEEAQHAFRASLEPATVYDVRVYPIGNDASRFPPHSFVVETTNVELAQDFAYPETLALKGRLLQETPLPPGATSRLRGLQVRLREKSSMAFVSSVRTLMDTGDFELFVAPDVVTRLADYELVLDLLREGQPWAATLAVEASRLNAERSVTITIPDIPELVSLIVALKTQSGPVPNADSIFVSDLQPREDQPVLPERDWCRLRTASNFSFRCNVRISTPLSGRVNQTVRLFPGSYDIFISPNADVQSAARVQTTLFPENVLPQPDGLQQGPAEYILHPPKLYTGRTVSAIGKAMPYISVTGNALNIRVSYEKGSEVEPYNRTVSSVSNGSGEYALAVDEGAYDLVASAPDGTGFPWYLSPNRQLTGEGQNVTILMSSPVLARGSVVDERNNPIESARVEAFAIVEDQSGERTVRIARTESSDAGTFTLLLPPTINHDPNPVLGLDGGTTARRDMDAGAPR